MTTEDQNLRFPQELSGLDHSSPISNLGIYHSNFVIGGQCCIVGVLSALKH